MINLKFMINLKARLPYSYKKKAAIKAAFFVTGGSDGARTRDPMRDRHVF